MNKKGVTAAMIIEVVLVIAAMLILLGVVFYFYDLPKQSKKDICHLKVVERATIPTSAQNLVSIKECETEKICLSLGEDCDEQFLAEKEVQKLKLPSNNPQEAARQIEE